MGHILAGLKVIDAASYVAGPAATTVMADFGANVIKVEPPSGDGYRSLAARYRTDYN
ncbi:MAG: crotonobetainyl-CoA:carnitine CoA-transferase CaiB-like acyl-CoA transferase, partial [Saprospiraceae bacterium]